MYEKVIWSVSLRPSYFWPGKGGQRFWTPCITQTNFESVIFYVLCNRVSFYAHLEKKTLLVPDSVLLCSWVSNKQIQQINKEGVQRTFLGSFLTILFPKKPPPPFIWYSRVWTDEFMKIYTIKQIHITAKEHRFLRVPIFAQNDIFGAEELCAKHNTITCIDRTLVKS